MGLASKKTKFKLIYLTKHKVNIKILILKKSDFKPLKTKKSAHF